MAYVKKTWEDRITEHPSRRTLTNVSTNQQQTFDVVRSEGNVSKEGDALNAENLNDLENRIAVALDPILQTVTEIKKVTSLPADAASHPTTWYVMTE